MWGQITSDILLLGRVVFLKDIPNCLPNVPFLHLWHLGKMNHSVWTSSQPSPKCTHLEWRVIQRVFWKSILVQCDCLVCLTRNLQALWMEVQPTASRRISTSGYYFKVEERWILLSPLIESKKEHSNKKGRACENSDFHLPFPPVEVKIIFTMPTKKYHPTTIPVGHVRFFKNNLLKKIIAILVSSLFCSYSLIFCYKKNKFL